MNNKYTITKRHLCKEFKQVGFRVFEELESFKSKCQQEEILLEITDESIKYRTILLVKKKLNDCKLIDELMSGMKEVFNLPSNRCFLNEVRIMAKVAYFIIVDKKKNINYYYAYEYSKDTMYGPSKV